MDITYCLTRFGFTSVYSIIYNRNYEAYTAEGGAGLSALVNISFRGVCIVTEISEIIIILLRRFLYVDPKERENYI